MPKKTPTDRDELLTPKAVAAMHRVHVSCVYRWVMRGHLPAVQRAGCRYLIRRADAEALLRPVVVKAPAAQYSHEAAMAKLRQVGLV